MCGYFLFLRANGLPCIGSDKTQDLSSNNPGTVHPEYVVGYISDGKFETNPYEKSEQRRYQYVVPESRETSAKTYY